MTFSEWLKKKGWRDADFAANHPFISRSQVSRIRRGVSKPTPAMARQLAEVTRIPAGKFVMGEAAERSA